MKPQIKIVKLVVSCWLLVSGILCVSAVILAGCGNPVASSEERVTSKPSLPATQYSLLIAQLGSDDWATRENVQKQLEDLPLDKLSEIEPTLKEASGSNDPEVRMRVRFILNVLSIRRTQERPAVAMGFQPEGKGVDNIYETEQVIFALDKMYDESAEKRHTLSDNDDTEKERLLNLEDEILFNKIPEVIHRMTWKQACTLYKNTSHSETRGWLLRYIFGKGPEGILFDYGHWTKDDIVNLVGQPDGIDSWKVWGGNGAWIYNNTGKGWVADESEAAFFWFDETGDLTKFNWLEP